MSDIRKILQECEKSSNELDNLISNALNQPRTTAWSKSITKSIEFIQQKNYDWIMGNVNGAFGGTPFGCVGVTIDLASYSATPLLSLWLSYFRLELGDERETPPITSI